MLLSNQFILLLSEVQVPLQVFVEQQQMEGEQVQGQQEGILLPDMLGGHRFGLQRVVAEGDTLLQELQVPVQPKGELEEPV